MKKWLMLGCIAVVLSGCVFSDEATVASNNLSKAADNFQVMRRIVFYNGITNEYILVITGYCSLGHGNETKSVTVTCMTAPGKYKKHFLGLSDNVTYVAEQIDDVAVSKNHYTVLFRPQAIIPNIGLTGDDTTIK